MCISNANSDVNCLPVIWTLQGENCQAGTCQASVLLEYLEKISVLNCILNAIGLVLEEDGYPFLVHVVSLKVFWATVGCQFTA